MADIDLNRNGNVVPMAEQCGATSLNIDEAPQCLHVQGERLRLQNRMLIAITGASKDLVTFC